MEFVDRIPEMERLDALAGRPGGGLAVIWGRRRVGKTRLMLEWSRKHGGLYTVADQSAPDIQRKYVAQALAGLFPMLAEASYGDWRSLLRALSREASASRWHGPVIFDELPYLVAAVPELPSVLQHWIDHEAREASLAVAVAGSSQRMMQGLALDSSAPLYGRASEAMEVKPIKAGYLRDGFKFLNPVDCVKFYAVWGGIPRYWELAAPYWSELHTAVDRCVLDPMGPLHGEPDRLLLDELPPALTLRPVLDAIGMGAHRLSEIAARVGQPATSLGRPLSRLIGMGLVLRETPFWESEKSTKRALYKIVDPFMRLWFRAVAPHRALLAHAPGSVRMGLWTSVCDSIFSQAWEELCRESISLMPVGCASLAQFGPWLPAGRFWRGRDPEWDVVSRSVDGKYLLLGEVKWSEKPISKLACKRIAADLIRKGTPALQDVASLEIIRCIFVPNVNGSVKRVESVWVLDARDVLECLR